MYTLLSSNIKILALSQGNSYIFYKVAIRTTSLVQILTIFAKSYVFYELPIRMNLNEWPTPNPAPKPTRHWGLGKLYEWGHTN